MATNGPVYGNYNKAVEVTKSDTVNIPGPRPLTDALYVGTAGVVACVFQDGSVVNFTAVAGAILPVAIKRVNSANTVPTLMVALYHV